jgi:ribulose-5-phosphate 4-epimerase/fuculose-1-phosphate aldolase
MIAVGPSLTKAMSLAVQVETLARQYHGCLQIGTPPPLSKAEIETFSAASRDPACRENKPTDHHRSRGGTHAP